MNEWFAKLQAEFILNFVEDNRWKYLVTGLGNTLKITLAAVLLGIVIGTLVAIIRSTWDQNADRMRPGAGKTLLHIGDIICKIYLTVIRGTPVVVQLMIMFYIIFATSRNGVGVAMLAFGVNSGAYVAELIRGGIMAIDKGQLEAGRSLGFDYVQTMRFIIVPQALKNVLPALANEFIVLLKETSVAGYVAVTDLTTGDIYCSDDFGDDHVQRFNKGADAVAALVSGKLDCVVIDNEPAKSFVAANEGLKVLDTAYAVEDYAAAFAKGSELTEPFNKALEELIADGTVQKIVDKYISAD